MFDVFTGGYVQVLLFCHLDLCVDTLKVKVTQSCLTLWDPTDYTVHGILQARIPEWVQFSSVGSLSLLQGIFPTQGSNPGLPHCRRILCQLSHQGSPREVKTNFVLKRFLLCVRITTMGERSTGNIRGKCLT